jgi:hypothetical protein
MKAARSERMLQALARGSISLRDVRDNALASE